MAQTSRVVFVVLIITGVMVGGFFIFFHNDRSDSPDSEVSNSTPSTNAAPSNDAQRVTEALQRLSSDPESLMATGVDSLVDGTADQAVPAGASIEVDETSWSPDGLGGGTIVTTITDSDGAEYSYLVVVVEEPDGWKVLATFPVEGAP